MEILAKLNTLVKQWVRDVSITKNMPPRNIERNDYFTSFFELLKKQREVTECRVSSNFYEKS